MSAAPAAAKPDALLADAARYLDDTAPKHGGRNARPLAVPVLVSTYLGSARTGRAVAASALGVVAGAATWFGLDALAQPRASVVLAVVALVVAAAAVVGAMLIGRRVLRSGALLVAALRRWYAVAPEVPVRGAEMLREGPGIMRLVLAGVGVLGGAAVLLLANATGTLAGWVGYGLAAASLLIAGVLAALGWWRVQALLRGAAPQEGQEAFAPERAAPPQPQSPHGWAPPPPVPPQPIPAQPVWDGPPHLAGGFPQNPGPLPQAPAPEGSQGSPWWPPPPGVQPTPAVQPAPAAQPVAAQQAWAQPVEESDLGDTRYVSDGTISGRARPVAVLLEDGRRLEVGIVTLVGRAPRPRPNDPAVTTIAVEDATVSKTHAAFRVAVDSVHVTDRSSTNGTTVVDDHGGSRRLRPWAEEPVQIGSEVLLGSYRVRIVEAD